MRGWWSSDLPSFSQSVADGLLAASALQRELFKKAPWIMGVAPW